MTLFLEGPDNAARTASRRLPGSSRPLGAVGGRFPARLRGGGAFLGRRQPDAGPPRLGEADRDGLLGGAGPVLALADVMDLLPHELARLGGRAHILTRILPRPFERFLFRHLALLAQVTPRGDGRAAEDCTWTEVPSYIVTG